MMLRKRVVSLLLAALAVAGGSVVVAGSAIAGAWHHGRQGRGHLADGRRTVTPIRHVVVIFGENVSFDHYFGTYPQAAGTDGQSFTASRHTPAVDGLPPATSPSLPPSLRHSTNLLTSNPNSGLPLRLDSSAIGASGVRSERRATRRSSWITTTATRSRACGTTRSTSR
jgi:phospholipase C